MRTALSLGCLLGLTALDCANPPPRMVPAKSPSLTLAGSPPGHRPRSRTWRLHPQTPFKLVGEGLRDIADLRPISGAMVVVGAACSVPLGTKRAPPTQVQVAVGDTFGTPPPLLLAPEGHLDRAEIQDGSWPNDLWLSLGYTANESSYLGGGLLAHWNGAAWQWLGREASLDPARVLAWHDGAKLVTQYLPRSRHGGSVKPFRVVGATSHAPPDFSALPFEPPRGDDGNITVDYASSSSHELFVAVALSGQARFGIGRTTSSGKSLLDKVDVEPARPEAVRFVVGDLNGKERVVAWTKLTQSNRPTRLWLRSHDRDSFVQVPSPPSFSEAGYTDVWFADGALWVRQASTIWRGDGGSWSKHATVSPYAPLTVSADGTLWTRDGIRLQRIGPRGEVVEVPLFEESVRPDSSPQLGRLVAGTTADDLWLEAHQGEETLLFGTRVMTNMLRCD